MQGNQGYSQEDILESLHLFIDALSANADIPNSDDHNFMMQFPFMLAGAFDAKGVPVSVKKIEESFDLIDPSGRESYFFIDPNYGKESGGRFEDDESVQLTPEERVEHAASFEALKAKLAEKGLLFGNAESKPDPLKGVVVAALRSDRRFAGLVGDDDVIERAKDIVESWVRQQINKVQIPADHAFWGIGGQHLLVVRHRENAVDTVMQIAREQRAQAVPPPELS